MPMVGRNALYWTFWQFWFSYLNFVAIWGGGRLAFRKSETFDFVFETNLCNNQQFRYFSKIIFLIFNLHIQVGHIVFVFCWNISHRAICTGGIEAAIVGCSIRTADTVSRLPYHLGKTLAHMVHASCWVRATRVVVILVVLVALEIFFRHMDTDLHNIHFVRFGNCHAVRASAILKHWSLDEFAFFC